MPGSAGGRRPSISRRLALGLLLIGFVAAFTLFVTMMRDYGFSVSDLLGPDSYGVAWHEMQDHVGLPFVVFLVPSAIAASILIHRAFQPLRRAARLIEETPAERGFRVPDAELPAEAMPFVEAVNRLLGRLDEAAAQQESFAADVAHELRTPLAILQIELDQPGGIDPARLRDELGAMRRLIDQLLLLAQVNAAATQPLPAREFALAGLAEDVVALAAPELIAAGRTIELNVVDPVARIRGHREAVGAALRNLVENAGRVTPPGGTVRVSCGPGAMLRVADGGSGLSSEELARLVRRHERAGHPSRDGAGLGLAIAQRIVAAHGGRLATDPDAREIRLEFPRLH